MILDSLSKEKIKLMSINVSKHASLNSDIVPLDDHRRRLGIASLHGKIKACLTLLDYANKVCTETAKSYEDPAQSEAHLYSCIEGVFTALSEVSEHSSVGLVLCQKIVGDNTVNPLEKFANVMKSENGVA